MSIFAKKVDKATAKVEFKEQELAVDLPMPGNKRFKASFPLYGRVEPGKCSFMVLGTKVEVKLKKGEYGPSLRGVCAGKGYGKESD